MWSRTPFATRLNTPGLNHIKRSPLSHPPRKRTHVFRTISSESDGHSKWSEEQRLCMSPNHDIYISRSLDPYFNLTYEDWLFRHAPPDKLVLMIYRDNPCVVVGRNQNPWTEVNFSAIRETGIPFLRRRSGGGTVYHDIGNSNFSIHLPRASFDRNATGQLILAAVRSLGVDANLNSRNDICVGTDKMSLDFVSKECSLPERNIEYHTRNVVCRSAYKIVNNRAYHHGTMLISSQLSNLGLLLRPQKEGIVTKAVGSVRSPVCNLHRYNPALTHDDFVEAVVEQFQREYGVSSNPVTVYDGCGIRDVDYIKKGMNELGTWEWKYGQTPEFTRTLEKAFPWGQVTVELHSKHGIILDSRVDTKDAHFSNTDEAETLHPTLTKLLEGKRYGFLEELETPSSERVLSQSVKDIYSWLQQTTSILDIHDVDCSV